MNGKQTAGDIINIGKMCVSLGSEAICSYQKNKQ